MVVDKKTKKGKSQKKKEGVLEGSFLFSLSFLRLFKEKACMFKYWYKFGRCGDLRIRIVSNS